LIIQVLSFSRCSAFPAVDPNPSISDHAQAKSLSPLAHGAPRGPASVSVMNFWNKASRCTTRDGIELARPRLSGASNSAIPHTCRPATGLLSGNGKSSSPLSMARYGRPAPVAVSMTTEQPATNSLGGCGPNRISGGGAAISSARRLEPPNRSKEPEGWLATSCRFRHQL
jgi:hypothetical protein